MRVRAWFGAALWAVIGSRRRRYPMPVEVRVMLARL
jgi:hypothetical protein